MQNRPFGKPLVSKQLQAWFPHTVTIEPFISQDQYGEDTWGTARTARAYVPPTVFFNRATNAYEVTTPVTVIVDDFDIGHRDKITLPNGYCTEVMSVDTHDYMPGASHTAVRLA